MQKRLGLKVKSNKYKAQRKKGTELNTIEQTLNTKKRKTKVSFNCVCIKLVSY